MLLGYTMSDNALLPLAVWCIRGIKAPVSDSHTFVFVSGFIVTLLLRRTLRRKTRPFRPIVSVWTEGGERRVPLWALSEGTRSHLSFSFPPTPSFLFSIPGYQSDTWPS